jgi:hypothetical protein
MSPSPTEDDLAERAAQRRAAGTVGLVSSPHVRPVEPAWGGRREAQADWKPP